MTKASSKVFQKLRRSSEPKYQVSQSKWSWSSGNVSLRQPICISTSVSPKRSRNAMFGKESKSKRSRTETEPEAGCLKAQERKPEYQLAWMSLLAILKNRNRLSSRKIKRIGDRQKPTKSLWRSQTRSWWQTKSIKKRFRYKFRPRLNSSLCNLIMLS